MKITVLGATGLIGKDVVASLNERGTSKPSLRRVVRVPMC